MNPEKKLCSNSAIDEKKKPYQTPTLTVHGSVKGVTQSALVVGSGDAFMLSNNLPDVLGS